MPYYNEIVFIPLKLERSHMKRILIHWVLFIVLVITGCASNAPETAAPTQPLAVTQPPAATKPPITETSALVTVTATSMEIGSTYYYVDGTTLVAVPAGEFGMGADGKDNPKHTVTLNDYWIYSTKVTNQQYALCEALGKCTSPDSKDNLNYNDNSRANDPVVGVTYDQAAAYCSFVNGRLPTEAEWEKSARNPDGSLYPWGNAAPSCDLLNFNNCVGGATNVIKYPKGTSYYGGLDLEGNSFEWVADWYSADYYANSPKENPLGPTSGTDRSVRSSSFASDASQVSLANRAMENPQNHRADLGFRCVVDDSTYFAPACAAPLVYGSDASGTPQSAESCPPLDIKQGLFCSGLVPETNITFSGPPDATIDYSDCIPSGTPGLFTCKTPKTIVSITAACQVNLTGNSLCPSGFSQQNNQCVANGRAGQCLDGNYDSSQQCCTTQNTTELTSASPVCPVGTFYAKSKNACLANPVQEIVSFSAEVRLVTVASCEPTPNSGGGGNGGASPTTPTCNFGSWDPALNCCSENGICY